MSPFDEGALTGRITPETQFEEGDFRNEYFKDDRKREVYERVQSIADDLGVEEDKLPEIALRYVLSHPAVSTVIPGMRSVRNVERNVAVADGEGLSEEQSAEVEVLPLGPQLLSYGSLTSGRGDELAVGLAATQQRAPLAPPRRGRS